MLFSATLDRNVDLLVRRYLSDPVVHSVDPSKGRCPRWTTTSCRCTARQVRRRHRDRGPRRAGDHLPGHQARRGPAHPASACERSARRGAARRQVPAPAHPYSRPVQVGEGHGAGRTNVAARGIHVDNLDLVLNVDPPSDHKDYLHRGGRTARAGESGSVVTLVTTGQRRT